MYQEMYIKGLELNTIAIKLELSLYKFAII